MARYRTFRRLANRVSLLDDISDNLVAPAIGFARIHDNATATVIASSNTPVKAAGTYVLDSVSNWFSVVSNRMKYTGEETIICLIEGVLTAESGNNQEIGIYIAKNGSLVHESMTVTTTSGSGKSENIAFKHVIECSQNDAFDIWVENKTGSNNITCTALAFILEQVGG